MTKISGPSQQTTRVPGMGMVTVVVLVNAVRLAIGAAEIGRVATSSTVAIPAFYNPAQRAYLRDEGRNA